MEMDKALDKVKKQVAEKYNSVCPRCKTPFNCGVKDGLTCWCFYEKAGKTLTNMVHQDCLCKKCLIETNI